MARKTVLPSIETGGDPEFADCGVLSDDTGDTEDTYEGLKYTPEPTDPDERLSWGRDRYGEEWYQTAVAQRQATLNAQREREEQEKKENKKIEDIRNLQKTNPKEYERQMREYKLQLKGFTAEQIEQLNQPRSRTEAQHTWKMFNDGLMSEAPPPATAGKHVDARPRRRKSAKASRTIRHDQVVKSTAQNQPNRPVSTLVQVRVDEESASNATNVKVTRSKPGGTRQQKTYTEVRKSRRIANKPVESGIFAVDSEVPIPKNLQRNPTDPRSKKMSRSQ